MLRFRPKRKPDPAAAAEPAAGLTPPSAGEPAPAATPAPDDAPIAPAPIADEPPDERETNEPDDHDDDGDGEFEYEGVEAAENPALRPIAADERASVAHAREFIRSTDGEFTHEEVRERIVDVLQTIYDPEIPVDIYQLGLIYSIAISPDASVHVEMTLTSPACPVAGTLPPEVERKVASCDGVDSAKVEVVWDPPWNPGMMTEASRLELGFF
ncbi:MAG: DUF59 domain-containing protein [Planctomycetota bacterium]